MPRFQRASDPDRAGQVLLRDGEPLGLVFWSHDFLERERTGWFLELLDDDGEAGGDGPRRLASGPEVDALVADRALGRDAWLAQAETLELVTAAAAVEAAERALAEELGLA